MNFHVLYMQYMFRMRLDSRNYAVDTAILQPLLAVRRGGRTTSNVPGATEPCDCFHENDDPGAGGYGLVR